VSFLRRNTRDARDATRGSSSAKGTGGALAVAATSTTPPSDPQTTTAYVTHVQVVSATATCSGTHQASMPSTSYSGPQPGYDKLGDLDC
jgi:hypothetical protein